MGTSNKATTEGNEFLQKIISTTYTEPTPDKIVQFYNSNGEVYEKYIVETEFDAPYETAKSAGELHPNDRQKVRVLDVAAGTGLVSTELRKLGFKMIDALEPAEHMLAEAKKHGLYDRYICDYLGANTLDIKTDTYDVITLCAGLGALLAGDFAAGFRELLRVVKPGGYIIITSNREHFAEEGPDYKFMRDTKPLVREGKWKLVSKRDIHYSSLLKGSVVIFQKL